MVWFVYFGSGPVICVISHTLQYHGCSPSLWTKCNLGNVTCLSVCMCTVLCVVSVGLYLNFSIRIIVRQDTTAFWLYYPDITKWYRKGLLIQVCQGHSESQSSQAMQSPMPEVCTSYKKSTWFAMILTNLYRHGVSIFRKSGDVIFFITISQQYRYIA